MGDVVSLKLHRKRKDRAAKDEQAAENRAKFGRSKAEKALTSVTPIPAPSGTGMMPLVASRRCSVMSRE